MINTNTFYKTFSASDALAFMMFPQAKPILLGSITTLSHSVYREKKPVPLLGKINCGGYTRGMRSIAGSMVFTLVNQNLVEDIVSQIPYLKQHGKLKADELPFFDIMIVAANEYGAASQMMIYGAEFFEAGQVLSVQDIYIENTFSFVARDLDDFTKINPLVQGGYTVFRNLNADTVIPYDFYEDAYQMSYVQTISSYNNDEMLGIQNNLNNKGYATKRTGVLDNQTRDALYSFQKDNNLNRSGLVDDVTFNLLAADLHVDRPNIVNIENKNGTFVYMDKEKSNILGIAKYQDQFIMKDSVGDLTKIDFYGSDGYIETENTSRKKNINSIINNISTKPGTVSTTSLSDFDAEKIGLSLYMNKNAEIKLSSISYYEDGSCANYNRFYNYKKYDTTKYLLSHLPETYIYNVNKNSMPKMVEFFITIPEIGIKKWTIKFNK